MTHPSLGAHHATIWADGDRPSSADARRAYPALKPEAALEAFAIEFAKALERRGRGSSDLRRDGELAIGFELHHPAELRQPSDVLVAVKRGGHRREVAGRGDQRLKSVAEGAPAEAGTMLSWPALVESATMSRSSPLSLSVIVPGPVAFWLGGRGGMLFAEWSETANRGASRRSDDTPVLAGQTGPRRRATRRELMALVEQQRASYTARR